MMLAWARRATRENVGDLLRFSLGSPTDEATQGWMNQPASGLWEGLASGLPNFV